MKKTITRFVTLGLFYLLASSIYVQVTELRVVSPTNLQESYTFSSGDRVWSVSGNLPNGNTSSVCADGATHRFQLSEIILELNSTSMSEVTVFASSSGGSARTLNQIAIADSRDGAYTPVTATITNGITGSTCGETTASDMDIPAGKFIKFTFSGNANISGFDVTSAFTGTTYTLTTSANPAEAGSVTTSPAGPNFPEGTVVALTPMANRGYAFLDWTGDVTNDEVTMNGDKTVIANFVALTARTIDITATGCTSGSVSVTSTENDGLYYDGDVLTLTAVNSNECYFTQWSDGNTDNPRSFTVNGDETSLQAEFELDTEDPTLASYSPAEGSTVSITGTSGTQTITMNFSENIVIADATGITVNGTPATNPVVSGSTLTFEVDVQVNQSYTIEISNSAITDLAGNAYAGTSFTFNVDSCPAATLPFNSDDVFDDTFVLPCWISGGGVNYQQEYASDACGKTNVLRTGNDGIVDFYLPKCGTFTAIVSATGGRNFKLFVDGEEKASSGAVSSNNCQTLTYDVNTCTPVKVSIQGLSTGSAGGTTISSIIITDNQCTSIANEVEVDKVIVSEEYYTLTGVQVSEAAAGIYVKKVTYEDGSVDTIKVVK